MRIVCPECAAVYEVPDSLLGGEKRPLRCARCGSEWVPELPPPAAADPSPPPFVEAADGSEATLAATLADAGFDEDAAVSAADPAHAPVPIAPPLPSTGGRLAMLAHSGGGSSSRATRTIVGAGWAASALLLVMLLGAAYLWRGQVQTAWPPSQRAYAAIGLR